MKRTRKSNKKRLITFNRQDRYTLIEAVKRRRELWDINDNKHFQAHAINRAWKLVSLEVQKEVGDCRDAWTSLRDSLRYHLNMAIRKGAETTDWEFAKALEFLPMRKGLPASTSLDTLPSTSKMIRIAEPDQSHEEEPTVHYECYFDTDDQATTSQISITDSTYEISSDLTDDDEQNTAKNKSSEQREAPPDKLTELFEQLLEQQNHFLSLASQLPPASSQSVQPALQHYEMYAFWDTILREMPPAAIMEAKFKVTAYLQEIYEKYGTSIQVKQE